jgi:hypothetical protein
VPITTYMAPKIECGVPISLFMGNDHRTKFVVEFLLFRFIPYQRGAGPEDPLGGSTDKDPHHMNSE